MTANSHLINFNASYSWHKFCAWTLCVTIGCRRRKLLQVDINLLRSIPESWDAPCGGTDCRYFEMKRLYFSGRIILTYSLLWIASLSNIDYTYPYRYKNYNVVDACAPDAAEPPDILGLGPPLCTASLASKLSQIHRLALSRLPNVTVRV
jgi:hypothetical protein